MAAPIRTQLLTFLAKATEESDAQAIAQSIGRQAKSVSEALSRLGTEGLAEKGATKGSWVITDAGREEEARIKTLEQEAAEAEDQEPAVPSQADLFRGIGERLGAGGRKGDTRLEPLVYYVQRTANLDDLNSVWNALTEMGVANDVKKRWIKLYAQTIPGKEIPEDLKEKLEAGQEGEKVKAGTADDIPPKPKRFSLVDDQIIGDPEGDLNFKEALQLLAHNKGASPEHAESLAVSLSKLGPEMLTTILAAMTPLIAQGSSAQDNPLILALETRIEQLADAKHDADMEALRSEFRGAQRSPEMDLQIQTLGQQLSELRESLHQEQLANIQQQNKAAVDGLMGEIQKLSDRLTATAQGRQAENRYGIIEKIVEKGTGELSGIRQDLRGLGETILAKGATPRPRTQKEKAGFGSGLDKGIDKAHRAKTLADELWFGSKEQNA